LEDKAMTIMSGAQAVMEGLLRHGVCYIFGNPGTTEAPFMVALERYPQLTYVLGLQEAGVMGMADGYARARDAVGHNRVAVAHLHGSAGLANGLSGLYNAYRGGTPLLVLAGQSDTRTYQQEPALWADLVSMARPFTKWATEVLHAADLPMVLRRAFKVAAQPPSGPVFVSLPMNVLEENADIQDLSPATLYTCIRPDREGIVRAAELLCAAAHPLLLFGDRVAQSGAQAEALQLAERLGAPVYAVYHSEQVFPTDHPLFRGVLSPWFSTSLHMLREADVVLAVGADVLTPFLYRPRDAFGPSTRLLHLDSSPWAVDMIYPAEVGLVGDPKTGLAELLAEIEMRLPDEHHDRAQERIRTAAQEARQRRETFVAEARTDWDADTGQNAPIAPTRLTLALADALPENAVIIDEALTTSPPLHRSLTFSRPGDFYFLRGGAIGWGCGAAIGVALAQPERKVVAVIGDGSALYAIQALWTAAHHRLPITYILCNNSSYRILKVNLIRHLGEEATADLAFLGTDLGDPEIDFTRIAEGLGLRAWRVEQPDALRGALDAALTADGPTLVDVIIDGSL
jgi:benzoylformate decarboxylase